MSGTSFSTTSIRMRTVWISWRVRIPRETVERAASLPGVVGYVKKPFDLDEVLALVEKYLE